MVGLHPRLAQAGLHTGKTAAIQRQNGAAGLGQFHQSGHAAANAGNTGHFRQTFTIQRSARSFAI
jgi:2-oxo-4-hydroxy-4-carboxy--5-ureidoimidazoline (OHCU) decarboxylase